MATLTHAKGRTIIVPDDAVDYYASKGWTPAGQPTAPQKPKATKSRKGKTADAPASGDAGKTGE